MRALSLLLLATLLSACAEEPEQYWLGYIEGEPALIASPQAGWLTSVAVNRGSDIKLGNALFTLDAQREIAARDNAQAAIAAADAVTAQAAAQVAQTQAQRAEAEAQLMRTQQELERQRGLARIGATPERELEQAQAAYDAARALLMQIDARRSQGEAQIAQGAAQRRQAEASLVTAETNLAERTVHARVAGRVEDIYFRQGEFAAAGTPIVSILAPENVFVRFFIPEPELSTVQLGDAVSIGCDGCPDDLTATISFIAAEAEFTPPVIYSVTNRQKLVFKAEARTPNLTLRPGLPVDVAPLAP